MLDSQGRRMYIHVLTGLWRPGLPGIPPAAEFWRMLTMDDVRCRLFQTITATQSLRWLLLTKRPENVIPIMRRLRWPETGTPVFDHSDSLPVNVWLGATV